MSPVAKAIRACPALLVVMAALTSAGCAIGPIEHQGPPPPPGHDLVTDIARATRNVGGLVHRTEHQEPLPPPIVAEESAPPLVAPAPVASSLPPDVAGSPFYHDEAGVPLAQPLPGPPPRFHPVPTRPVFSTSHCRAFTAEF